MTVLDPTAVTYAPSGQYGFCVPAHRHCGSQGPIVQATQLALDLAVSR